MARDTPLGFPAHTLPYRRGESTTFIDSFGHAACSALVIARRNDGRNRAYPARRLLSAAISSSMLMGLDRKPFMPHSSALFRSSSKALAVMARIGIFTSAGSGSARICLVA